LRRQAAADAGQAACRRATFPLLVHNDTHAVMSVPVEFWPQALLELWKNKRL